MATVLYIFKKLVIIMVRKLKDNGADKEKKGENFTCLRCRKSFSSMSGLRVHSRKHLKRESMNELRLLEQGHVPEKNKIGSAFKGKNKIIIS